MELVLHRGLPGSGKSTAAKQLVESGYCHFENDMFFMVDGEYKFDQRKAKDAADWCFKSTEEALKLGKDVVVSNVFVTVGSILRYKKLADKLGARFSVKRFIADYGNVHNVPEAVLKSMASSFQDFYGEVI